MTDTDTADTVATDKDLVDRFEDGTLAPECFHHREHVRIAFLYSMKYPVLEALEVFSRTLRKFAEAHGKPQLYHQTITWFYVFLVQERIAKTGTNQNWDEFASRNPDLLVWKEGILTRYYRAETLASDMARAVFVLPDLRT